MKRHRLVFATLTIGSLAALPAAGQDPRALVARAVTAVGGDAALRGLGSVSADFNTVTFALGQEETPASPARATFVSGRMTTDWTAGRRFTTQESRPVAGPMARQRRVIADGLGFQQADTNPPAYFGVGQLATEERILRLAPERLLRSAVENPASVSAVPAKTLRGASSPGVRYAAGPDTLNLFFDPMSGRLLATEQVTDDPILGDRRTVTWYTRWEDAGGVKLPRQVDVEAGGRMLSHTVHPSVSANPTMDASQFAIPDRAAAERARGAAPAVAVVSVKIDSLAPGVWAAQGGTHHSLIVEQASRLIVVEGPQTSARTQAVLDTLKKKFPNKPVSLVVNTHHHWDHAGGLRGYMAAGVPVLTHERNGAFVRAIATATKTVAPDALSRGGRAPQVRTVTDSVTVGAGDGRVQVFSIPTAHVEGMLMVYVPSAQLLFQSDLFGVGQPPNRAFVQQLVAAVRARGLKVGWVTGGHGGLVAKWEDVEKAAM